MLLISVLKGKVTKSDGHGRQSQRKESELMPAPLLVYESIGKWLEALVHPETNIRDVKPCHGTLSIFLNRQANLYEIAEKCKHTIKWVFHNLKYYSVRHAYPNSTSYVGNYTTF